MNKILEYKNQDWLKGISAQPNVAMGGLFQSIFNFDPFEQGGLCIPSLSPDAQALGTTPKFLNDGAGNFIYALSDTNLYQVLKDTPYTVTDKTSEINQKLTSGTALHQIGATVYKGKYIYVTVSTTNNGYISANALPVASTSDVLIGSAFNERKLVRFCQGADGNLYYNFDIGTLGEITSVTGLNTQFFSIDDGFSIRDIINDGRYLVILADNNTNDPNSRVVGSFKCQVYYWDMVQTTVSSGKTYIVPVAKYEFTDSYLIGGQLTDKGIQFFGYNGLYVTNVATEPKMIRPFFSSTLKMGRPFSPYQILFYKGTLYWVDGFSSVNSYIYAYGNPTYGQQKIFYIPYFTGLSGLSQCLMSLANNFILGNDAPSLYFFNKGTTRGALQLSGLDTNMPTPHTYGYTKVVLGQKLSSGQSVQVVTQGNGGNSILSSETQSYNSANPKQTLLFRRTPSSTNQPDKFEDITLSVVATGCPLQRVSVYADPIADANNDI